MLRIACLLVALAAACSAASIPSDRIVGGWNAAANQIPWQVSLRRSNRHFCGGSIVNARWVVTAAHCLGGTVASVTAVTNTLFLNSGGDHYQVSRFVIHPNYNAQTIRHDVGLVQTASNIIWRTGAQPARLPTGAFNAVNYPARASGWGSTFQGSAAPNHLQVVDLLVVSQAQCRTLSWQVTDENICTFTRAGQGTCQGDSGGPLTADGILIGIVSFGVPCARGLPDAYARVWTYLGWIRSHTG